MCSPLVPRDIREVDDDLTRKVRTGGGPIVNGEPLPFQLPLDDGVEGVEGVVEQFGQACLAIW